MAERIITDARHDDPRIGLVKSGEQVRLGTALGVAMEPSWLWARLVGIAHTTGPRRFIVRKYRPGDGWYPTGEYLRTTIIGLVPWDGKRA